MLLESIISETEGISSLTEEQRMALKAFLHRKDVFTLHLTGFVKFDSDSKQFLITISHIVLCNKLYGTVRLRNCTFSLYLKALQSQVSSLMLP